MGHYLLAKVHNEKLSVFLGFWATLTNALFAYIGTELIGVTVGEAENPRKNIRTYFAHINLLEKDAQVCYFL
jgi:yeast amino acid transporter